MFLKRHPGRRGASVPYCILPVELPSVFDRAELPRMPHQMCLFTAPCLSSCIRPLQHPVCRAAMTCAESFSVPALAELPNLPVFCPKHHVCRAAGVPYSIPPAPSTLLFKPSRLSSCIRSLQHPVCHVALPATKLISVPELADQPAMPHERCAVKEGCSCTHEMLS